MLVMSVRTAHWQVEATATTTPEGDKMNDIDMDSLSTGKLLHLAQMIVGQLEKRIRTADDRNYQQLRNLLCRHENTVDNIDDTELDQMVDRVLERLERQRVQAINLG